MNCWLNRFPNIINRIHIASPIQNAQYGRKLISDKPTDKSLGLA